MIGILSFQFTENPGRAAPSEAVDVLMACRIAKTKGLSIKKRPSERFVFGGQSSRRN